MTPHAHAKGLSGGRPATAVLAAGVGAQRPRPFTGAETFSATGAA